MELRAVDGGWWSRGKGREDDNKAMTHNCYVAGAVKEYAVKVKAHKLTGDR